MDKKTTVGYILILVLFVAYLFINKNTIEQIEEQEEKAATEISDSIPAKKSDTTAVAINDTLVSPDSVQESRQIEAKTFVFENDKISIEISNIGGIPQKINLKEFKRYDSSDLVMFTEGDLQFEYVIPLANGSTLSSRELEFVEESQSEGNINLVADLGQNRKIIQRYSFAEESEYLIDYQVEFSGFANTISPRNRFIELLWSAKMQQQEKSLEDERNATTIYYKYENESGVDYLSETSEDEETLDPGIEWISFKQKFFNYTLINKKGFAEDGFEIQTEEANSDEYIEYLKADLYLPVALNDREVYSWQLYAGPNHYKTLKKMDVGLQQIIPLGWGIFGWVNKGLVIPVFNWLSQYFSNYGIIIFFLTLIIKVLLFIPMFKVYKSSAKMRLLKPELDEIKEKAGGDMQKMQAAQMKLYKQAGVSPLGGCLPQLVQLPILFAMFRFFPSSIELRQESLWWADDLSTYDSIWDFPGDFSIWGYGDHVSLFTLLMTVVTVIYTYMNSQASAGMTGPMKWMMYLMPIMFLGFFNNYAAALSFYYFTATCITIIQNFVIRKFFIDEDKLHKELQENKKKKVSVKKTRLQKRLEDMAKKRGIDPNQGPPKRKR
ncbi:membrane protein insertase YidC [bacterium]|nr:membrane protein insertase YidC [bacterium]